jgi:hypothetical protein
MHLATFRGRNYRSTGIRPDGTVRLFFDSIAPPEDDEFTRHPEADVWIRVVRAEECERVVEVTTGARYGAHQCHVESIDEKGMALVFASGGSAPPGFEQVERGVYQKTVHVTELRDYREVHGDVLFRYLRDRVFGPQVRP